MDVVQLVGIVAGGAGAVVIAPIEQVPLVREWIRCVQFLDDGSCGVWLGRLERYCDIVKYSVAVEKACKLGSVTGRINNDDEFGRFSVAFVGIQTVCGECGRELKVTVKCHVHQKPNQSLRNRHDQSNNNELIVP